MWSSDKQAIFLMENELKLKWTTNRLVEANSNMGWEVIGATPRAGSNWWLVHVVYTAGTEWWAVLCLLSCRWPLTLCLGSSTFVNWRLDWSAFWWLLSVVTSSIRTDCYTLCNHKDVLLHGLEMPSVFLGKTGERPHDKYNWSAAPSSKVFVILCVKR